MKLSQISAIWFAAPLTIGVLLGFQVYAVFLAIVLLVCLGYFRSRSSYYKGAYNTIIGCVIAILAGMGLSGLQLFQPNNSVEKLVGKKLWLQGKMASEIKETKFGWSLTLETDSVESNGAKAKVTGSVLVFISNQKLICRPASGDKIRLLGNLQEVSDSNSYGKWLHQQGVKAKINAFDFQYIGHSSSGLNGVRLYVCGLFEKHLSDSNRGLATALLLGIKQDVPSEVKQAFIRTGAAHILAVSGMHVSLIFGMLGFCLVFLKKFRYGEIAINLILLVAMWGYCFLAGASPSIVRAVLTGSLVIMGNLFGRKSNGLNLLAIAWVLQIAIEPTVVNDLGFQLSYAAVLGILLLANPTTKFFTTQNWLVKQIQQIIIVSIAAQLFTLPIILVNFGTFPTWFLLTNLLIIPLASLVTYAVTALTCLGFIPVVSDILGFIVNSLLDIMKWMMRILSELPLANIGQLYISPIFGAILFGGILVMSIYFLSKIYRTDYRSLLHDKKNKNI
ncbi:MAG: ComEC family competence protein [Bacteroidia bacterium]|nr:ComEC family competence protein [Bacteroidia bacterium]